MHSDGVLTAVFEKFGNSLLVVPDLAEAEDKLGQERKKAAAAADGREKEAPTTPIFVL